MKKSQNFSRNVVCCTTKNDFNTYVHCMVEGLTILAKENIILRIYQLITIEKQTAHVGLHKRRPASQNSSKSSQLLSFELLEVQLPASLFLFNSLLGYHKMLHSLMCKVSIYNHKPH